MRAVDSLQASERDRIGASFTSTPPRIDGRLDDWRLVRWSDLAGAEAVIRGPWTGPWDLRLHFALQWTPAGILLGARLSDDVPTPFGGPFRLVERVTFAIASEDPVVQRYWMGPTRRFRIARDGRLDAWTDVHGRRVEPFDAAAVGVRAAADAEPPDRSGSATPTGFELFVPWDALFPLVPTPRGRALVNVIVEDQDGATEKVAAWSTRRIKGKLRPVWAALEFGGARSVPGWIVSAATPYPEPWCEWSIAAWGPSPSRGAGRVELRPSGIPDSPPRHGADLPSGDRFLMRFGPIEPARSVRPSERRSRLELMLPGEHDARTWEIVRPVQLDALRGAAESTQGKLAGDAPERFPAPADVTVRLASAERRLQSMGTWAERRFHPTGVPVWRVGVRRRVERELDEAEALGAAVGGATGPANEASLERLWPRRGLGGLPAGEPVLRGYRSSIDGTVQPYVVFVPDTTGPRPPLLVALHDVDQDESTLLASTTLARRCATRGWIVLAPQGRGNSGYLAAGERDVVDALAAVRADLPIDGRRIYVTGLGMGGTGAWLLPLRHPELFAAAAIVSGYGDLDQPGIFDALGYRPAEEPWYEAHNPIRLVRADLTTAFRIVHGEHDAVVSPVHARILHARLQELGVAHEYRLDPAGDHGLLFFDDELAANLEFLGRAAQPSDGRANPNAFAGAGPPIADVFARGPFAIVWGTTPPAATEAGGEEGASAGVPPAVVSDDRATADQLAAEWSTRYHGTARVLADTSVSADLMRTTNLVLVGSPETNSLLALWASRLPVPTEAGIFTIGRSGYPLAKFGVIYAATNPEFPERSLVVLSGMKDRIGILPRSAFAVATAFAVVSPAQGIVAIGNFTE